jgi:TRAP-type uncharacterized transport system fused permease subunit
VRYGHWSVGIGDPTVAGWITVAVYFLAAWLCVRTRHAPSPEGRWWLAMSALMLFLGINKQLDLQSLFTEIGRDLARAQGWYDESRHTVQLDFIAAMLVSGVVAGVALALTVGRRVRNWARLSMLAVCALGVWVLIRATSFHHVDEMLGYRFAGLRYNTLLELGPLSVIALAAWKAGEVTDERT